LAKLLAIFYYLPELFLCPQKKLGEKLHNYTMLSDIFIFVKILKLQFFPNFLILWQHLGKIQSLGPKYTRNFRLNIEKNVGAATLPLDFSTIIKNSGTISLWCIWVGLFQ